MHGSPRCSFRRLVPALTALLLVAGCDDGGGGREDAIIDGTPDTDGAADGEGRISVVLPPQSITSLRL
jgi:hypothetical protein